MDEATTLKTLDQLIQMENKAARTYDLVLETVTDPIIRAQLKAVRSRHVDHAEQLSREVLKMANEMIAEHWDAITSAALCEQQPGPEPKMRIASTG